MRCLITPSLFLVFIQIKETLSGFNEIDKNRDGWISRQEMKDYVKTFDRNYENFVNTHYPRLDKNKNMQVDKIEWKTNGKRSEMTTKRPVTTPPVTEKAAEMKKAEKAKEMASTAATTLMKAEETAKKAKEMAKKALAEAEHMCSSDVDVCADPKAKKAKDEAEKALKEAEEFESKVETAKDQKNADQAKEMADKAIKEIKTESTDKLSADAKKLVKDAETKADAANKEAKELQEAMSKAEEAMKMAEKALNEARKECVKVDAKFCVNLENSELPMAIQMELKKFECCFGLTCELPPDTNTIFGKCMEQPEPKVCAIVTKTCLARIPDGDPSLAMFDCCSGLTCKITDGKPHGTCEEEEQVTSQPPTSSERPGEEVATT